MVRWITLITIIVLGYGMALSQPGNDDCTAPFEVTYSTDESSAILTAGDTRGATRSGTPVLVCSTTWFSDDVWFTFTTPDTLPLSGLTVKAYFDTTLVPSDVKAIGMALYASCDSTAHPFRCFSSDDPDDTSLELNIKCLEPERAYFIRIWSTGNTPESEGTFSIGVFGNTTGIVPLWEETFDGGIEANGWTTEGTCAEPDSNHHAGWRYSPLGLIDRGAFIFAGAAISSPTVCDGAVGVDSDYNNTYGIQNGWGGPCEAPEHHVLTSPEIDCSTWTAPGITLMWNQAIRNFMSEHYISYRVRDSIDMWGEWIDIKVNTEFPIHGNFENNNLQRFFLPGAAGYDRLQIRFIYDANYYFWIIDDVKLIETEANNLACDTDFYAIPPWAMIPTNQVRPYFGLHAIRNIGAHDQTNVIINHVVRETDSQQEIYNENLSADIVPLNSVTDPLYFPDPIEVPAVTGNYIGTYAISQDQVDFDSSNNAVSYSFTIGGSTFANESGFTRTIAMAETVYEDPAAWGYGNVFYPVQDAAVHSITCGVLGTTEVTGDSIQLHLIEWIDENQDQVAQVSERRLIGLALYIFSANDIGPLILHTPLSNVTSPGMPIIMNGGSIYFAMMIYHSDDGVGGPTMYMMASDERNFTATVAAFDSAYTKGVVDTRLYMSVLAYSPDGILNNIDYEVRDLNPNDNRLHLGDAVVPMIRIETGTVSTDPELPLSFLIQVSPNPASEEINLKLKFPNPVNETKIRVIDMQGRVVYEKEITQIFSSHSEKIIVSQLTAGQYLLQVETFDGQRSVPIAVVRR